MASGEVVYSVMGWGVGSDGHTEDGDGEEDCQRRSTWSSRRRKKKEEKALGRTEAYKGDESELTKKSGVVTRSRREERRDSRSQLAVSWRFHGP